MIQRSRINGQEGLGGQLQDNQVALAVRRVVTVGIPGRGCGDTAIAGRRELHGHSRVGEVLLVELVIAEMQQLRLAGIRRRGLALEPGHDG